MTAVTPLFRPPRPSSLEPSDLDLVERVRAGAVDSFTSLMRRHNRRIYRVVRSILWNDCEAEDATQDAWLLAYTHLHAFEGRGAFGGWLTRIAVRCASAHAGRARILSSLDDLEAIQPESDETPPDENIDRRELARLLERAIDRLPASYRLVIVLRDVERMSTNEAASALGVSEESLRVRLHRARSALKSRILEELGGDEVVDEVFPFAGERCDRIVETVVVRLQRLSQGEGA